MSYKFEFSKKNINENEKNFIEKEISKFVSTKIENLEIKDIENFTRNRNYNFSLDKITNIIKVYIIN